MILQDFYDGKAFDAYSFFGAHIEKDGVIFRTYAPNADFIEVIGEFNGWRGELMSQEGQSGVFTVKIPDAADGQMYKYRIHQRDGGVTERSDPYGFRMELRPACASIICMTDGFRFTDKKWVTEREKNYDKPMNVYEVHLGSWKTSAPDSEAHKKPEKYWYSYRELAKPLIEYLTENHFTHVEIMPLSEHPADCSWGYQVTGFFSPTARYGTPDELKYLINECHKAGIGVITDFVPVHFAVDENGLKKYDGTALYEYPSDIGYSEWGSYNFNYYRGEVCSFMQSAANYWLSEFHFDGIRMDAISNMLYWQGNSARGVNNGAVKFLKKMNSGLHKIHPGAILIAEDSSNFLKVTAPAEYDGLGFDYKWDMGWMNDTLNFLRTPPDERQFQYHKITFSMQYFHNELYMLPFSHDEVVHGKATVIQKMWGEYDVKFPQCRALYAYMFAHPGKKLNFMGNEFAQFREWDEQKQQDWLMLKYPIHDAFKRCFADLARIYKETPALYCGEYNPECFKWLEADAPEDCVYAFMRKSGASCIVAVFNFSDRPYNEYRIPIDAPCTVTEIFNSDSDIYGGSTPLCKAAPKKATAKPYRKYKYFFSDRLAQFSAKYYEIVYKQKPDTAKPQTK